MSSVSWESLRGEAVARFGGYPGGQIEADVIEAIRELDNASVVRSAIDEVGRGYDAGKVTFPWGLFRKKLRDALDSPRTDVQVSAGDERENAVAHADRWMHTEGLFIESAEEMEHQLFGIPRSTPTGAELRSLRAQLEQTHPGFDQLFHGRIAGLLDTQIAESEERDPEPLIPMKPLLAKHVNDMRLRRRMADLWLGLAPVGQQMELDAEARGRDDVAKRAKMRERAAFRAREAAAA